MKRVVTPGLSILFLLALTAPLSAAPVKVFVSILPQKYFLERIGGELVDVSVMVEPGASPATYEPKPRQMVALAKTKIYFAIGVPFEKAWLEKIASTNGTMRVVHTETGIEKISMKEYHPHWKEGEYHHADKGDDREEAEQKHHTKEEHNDKGGEDEKHHRGIKDPHVWLSPPLVMVLARNILRALVSVDPAHRPVYDENYKNFIIELVDLDEEFRSVFAGKGMDIEFMVFHPAWGYFAHAYGLEQFPIEIEGKEPKPAELARLIEHARERGVKLIFVQPQFSSQIAETIARSIGGQIAFVDPLAPNWVNNLREVARKFKAALR